MVICLEQSADLHIAQLMPLPLTVSCFNKIQSGFTFLVLAHLGSPGKGPLNGRLIRKHTYRRDTLQKSKINQICMVIHTRTCLMILLTRVLGRASTRKVKPIWILLKQETVSGSDISWAICKPAPHSRQITTPNPPVSFLQFGCSSCRPTNSIKALKAVVWLYVIVCTEHGERTQWTPLACPTWL